jgi:hypothetical protein
MKLLEPYKEKMMFFTTQENLYEKFALQKFRSYIPTKRPYHLYYFHTKGVSRGPLESPPPIRVGEEQRVVPRTTFYNTRRNMDYFILEKHDICTWWLGHGYDAVGTALSRHPALHFSGNFWWATSEHLSRLPPLRDSYYGAEMHICSVPGGRYISLCQLTNTHPPSELRRIPDADIIRHSTSVPVENVSDRGMSI